MKYVCSNDGFETYEFDNLADMLERANRIRAYIRWGYDDAARCRYEYDCDGNVIATENW